MDSVFPNEILELIIGNLKDEHNTLLNCRLVSKTVKLMAEEVFNKNNSLWAPLMEDDFLSFLKRMNGTRFSTADQVTLFLKETENCPNPFPNGTVIICPEPYMESPLMVRAEHIQNDDFYSSFSSLVETNLDSITTLVCYFSISPDIIRAQVESILKLRNLRSLTVYIIPPLNVQRLDDFGRELSATEHEWFNRMGEFKLELTSEFIIFGDKNLDKTGMNFSSPVRALLPAILDSVTRLRFHYDDKWEMDWKCAKLETLELCGFRRAEFSWSEGGYEMPLLKLENSPNLEEINVKFPNNPFTCSGLSSSLDHLCSFLNPHSEKLVGVCLGVGTTALNCNKNPAIVLEVGFTFPKVKCLTLHYDTCIKWSNLLGFCKEKFPNLEEVKLLIKSEDKADEREYNENLMGLWEQLPDKVGVIRIPHFGWELKRNLSI